MAKYRKKPVIVEAIQWVGANQNEMFNFLTNYKKMDSTPTLEEDTFRIDLCNGGCQVGNLIIKTLEGEHIASIGDWIIKGINGEFYPCKPDIFEKTYELCEDKHIPERRSTANLGIEYNIPPHVKIKCPKCKTALITSSAGKPLRVFSGPDFKQGCIGCGTIYDYLEMAELIGNANKADG